MNKITNINLENILKKELTNKHIPFKENNSEIIIQCPVCYYKDNKVKLKLYVKKDNGIFHCFRCNTKYNTKGNIFKLTKILNEYYNIDLSTYFDIDTLISLTTNYEKTFLSDILNSIDDDFIDNFFKNITKKSLLNLSEVKQNIILPYNKKYINVYKKVKYYLNNRYLSFNLIKHLPYIIGNNPNSKLYYRFGLLTFFKTGYELRLLIDSKKELRYLQSDHKDNIDFIFLLPKKQYYNIFSNNIINNYKKRIFLPVNKDTFKDKILKSKNLFIVEGLFDALKLNIFLDVPVISLSGYNKFKNTFIFIKILSLIFKEFKIDNIYYIFDKDIENTILLKIISTINMYKKYIPVNNIQVLDLFSNIKNDNIKDIGDIKTVNDLTSLLNDTDIPVF